MTLTALLLFFQALGAAPACAPLAPLRLPVSQASLEARHEALAALLERESTPGCRQAVQVALGETLLALGRDEAAIEPLTWATLEPAADATAWALRLLGEAYARQNATSEALECYVEARRLDPEGAEGRRAWEAASMLARFRVRAAWRPTDAYARDRGWQPPVPGKGRALALAVSPSGELAWVAKNGYVLVDPAGGHGERIPLKEGRAACFDAAGELWIGTRRRVIGPSGPLGLVPPAGPGKLDVEALALDARGRLLVVSDGDALLYESLTEAPTILGRATDVAALEDGFAILNRKLREIRLWPTPRHIDLRQVAPEIQEPEALASDRLGNLYLLDRSRSTIFVHTLEGKLLAQVHWSVAELELKKTRDLAVDGTGRIYVLQKGGQSLARLH